jgi:NAD(P)-dependent dehydrogenase (short-subunit alcohol dehydrogenase family)
MVAYGQSKTANIDLATEFERRYAEKCVHALDLHLGSIQTGLQTFTKAETFSQEELTMLALWCAS